MNLRWKRISMHTIINYLVEYPRKMQLNAMNRLFLFWILMKESIYLSFLHLEGVMWQRKSV